MDMKPVYRKAYLAKSVFNILGCTFIGAGILCMRQAGKLAGIVDTGKALDDMHQKWRAQRR